MNTCSYAAGANTLYFTVQCGQDPSVATALDGTVRRPLGAQATILGVTSDGPLLGRERRFMVLHDGATRAVESALVPTSSVRRSRRRGPDLYVLGFFGAKDDTPPPIRQTLVRLRDGSSTLVIVKQDLGSRASFDVEGPWIYFDTAEGVRRMPAHDEDAGADAPRKDAGAKKAR